MSTFGGRSAPPPPPVTMCKGRLLLPKGLAAKAAALCPRLSDLARVEVIVRHAEGDMVH